MLPRFDYIPIKLRKTQTLNLIKPNLELNIIQKVQSEKGLSRRHKDTKSIRVIIEILGDILKEFYDKNEDNFSEYLSYYFSNNVLKRNHLLLGFEPQLGKEKYNNFHIEVLDLMCIYVSGDFKMTFFNWAEINSPEELRNYLSLSYQNFTIDSLDDVYASNIQDQNSSNSKSAENNNLSTKNIQFSLDAQSEQLPPDKNPKDYIQEELIKDNLQAVLNVLNEIINAKAPYSKIAIINITSDLNDINLREIKGQISQKKKRFEINQLKERIYKLANTIIE